MSSTRRIFDSPTKKQIQEHYDKDAATYDPEDLIDRRPENDYVFWHYLRNAIGARKKKVLDVGGGTGRIAIPLINEGHEVVVVDISRQMLAQARKKSNDSEHGSNLQLVQADAESLPFRDRAAFDLVICLGDVLSYCNTDTALAEIVSVLKTAGALLVGVDNRYGLAAEVLDLELDLKKAEELIKTGVGHYPEDWGGHLVKTFTADELRTQLGRHKITIQDIIARPFLSRCLTRQKRRRLYRSPTKTSILCELELLICKEPSILGASAVLFAVGRKTK